MSIENILTEEEQLILQAGNYQKIKNINDLSDNLKLELMKKDIFALDYIDITNASEQFKLAAVKQNGYAINFIKNVSEDLKLEAVKQNGLVISAIRNPSEEMQLAAVKQNGKAYSHVPPSEFLILESIKQDASFLKNVLGVKQSVAEKAFEYNPFLLSYAAIYRSLTAEQIKKAIHKNRNVYNHIELPSQEIKDYYNALTSNIEKLKSNPKYIREIENPTEEDFITVAKSSDYNYLLAEYGGKLSEKVYLIALENDFIFYDHLNLDPISDKVRIAAVRKDYNAIDFINKPSVEVLKAAVESGFKYAFSFLQRFGRTEENKEVFDSIIKYYNNDSTTEKELEDIIEEEVENILYINHPSNELIKKAIKRNPNLITSIPVYDYDERLLDGLLIEVVDADPELIDFIVDPSEAVVCAAVKSKRSKTTPIKNLPEETKEAAIEIHPKSIALIENPSEALQILAVKCDPRAIKRIINPCQEAKDIAKAGKQIKDGSVLKSNYLPYPEEDLKSLIKNNGFLIRFVEKPSKELQILAVEQTLGFALKYIAEPDPETEEKSKQYPYEDFRQQIKQRIQSDVKQIQLDFYLKIVQDNGSSIKCIENPIEELQLAAVKQNGIAIKYIKNPSEQVQLEAVKQFGSAIQFIKNPSEQVQLEAVQNWSPSITYIENPSEQVQLEAVRKNIGVIAYIKNKSKAALSYVEFVEKILEIQNNIEKALSYDLSTYFEERDYLTQAQKNCDIALKTKIIDDDILQANEKIKELLNRLEKELEQKNIKNRIATINFSLNFLQDNNYTTFTTFKKYVQKLKALEIELETRDATPEEIKAIDTFSLMVAREHNYLKANKSITEKNANKELQTVFLGKGPFIKPEEQTIQERITRERIKDHPVNWDNISCNQELSEEFIREFKDNVNWYYISKYQKLSEDFIREFKGNVSWYNISYHQKLSEEFIREFKDKVDWNCISRNQKISEEFIREFKDKVDWNCISRNQKISEEIIREFKDMIEKIYKQTNEQEIQEQTIEKTEEKTEETTTNEFLSLAITSIASTLFSQAMKPKNKIEPQKKPNKIKKEKEQDSKEQDSKEEEIIEEEISNNQTLTS